jgi:hypothetical protein
MARPIPIAVVFTASAGVIAVCVAVGAIAIVSARAE